MITPDYCQMMARYGAWQNGQIAGALAAAPPALLTRDEGAFFGSILGTLNHLLWGDTLWMSRFDGRVDAPGGGIAQSAALYETPEDYMTARRTADAAIRRWADGLTQADLGGGLSWYSGALGADVTKPVALCVTHMFNHQTHHRGQAHAMLTRAGLGAPVTDLFIMPEDA